MIRKLSKISVTLVIAGFFATACSSGNDDSEVTLSFAWWGSDARAELTQEVIDLFEEEHPGITIEPTFGSMENHFDRLATQTAGGDSPDIIQMDERYLREYADRNALLPLDGVDVSEFDDVIIQNGTVDETLYAVTMGINTHAIVANPELFEQAGVDIPDDSSWTWDDFAEITQQLSENSEEAWGTVGPRGTGLFQTWLRQQGLGMNTVDGDLGFSASDATDYFEYFLELVQNGTMPDASLIQEQQTVGMEQSLAGAGREGLGTWWSNESVALSQSVGSDLKLMHYPTNTGDVSDSKPWLKSSMYLSGAASTDHPEEVQEFIDFYVNSEGAGLISMVERGLPPSQSVREAVVERLDGMELATAEYIERIEPLVEDPEPISPVGGSELSSILTRYEAEVYFGNISPNDAAESMIDEMQSSID